MKKQAEKDEVVAVQRKFLCFPDAPQEKNQRKASVQSWHNSSVKSENVGILVEKETASEVDYAQSFGLRHFFHCLLCVQCWRNGELFVCQNTQLYLIVYLRYSYLLYYVVYIYFWYLRSKMVYFLVLSEYPSIFTLTYHIRLDRTLDVSQSCLFQVATHAWNSSGKKRNLFSTFKLWIVGLLLERSQSGQNL